MHIYMRQPAHCFTHVTKPVDLYPSRLCGWGQPPSDPDPSHTTRLRYRVSRVRGEKDRISVYMRGLAGRSEMELSSKKLEILKLLGRMEIGYARDISILLGSKELTADRKRLSELEQEKYISESWQNGKKAYYLTRRGLSMIDTHMSKPYTPGGYTTNHALYMSDLAAYIHLMTGISHESFIFDREMEGILDLKPTRPNGFTKRSISKVHAPDLVIGNRCYEAELTLKAKYRIKSNFEANARLFEKQVWLIPNHLHSLHNYLRQLSKEYQCPIQIITIDDLTYNLSCLDLHQNELGRKVELQLKQVTKSKSIMEELK